MPTKVLKANRSTKSDRAFVRSLYRRLKRLEGHDARIATNGTNSASSPVPVLNDRTSGPGGTAGPNYSAYTTLLARLDALYFFWTGKHLS